VSPSITTMAGRLGEGLLLRRMNQNHVFPNMYNNNSHQGHCSGK
jgi:hypothetical protein